MQAFTQEIIDVLRDLPEGKVSSYGRLAKQAGHPRAARQVVRVLHTYGEKENLPWWRVVNAAGHIVLPPGNGFEEQTDRLDAEGIRVSPHGKIDLQRYLWKPDGMDEL
ncbi:MAG: MGMT family protein [Pontiella sp.]